MLKKCFFLLYTNSMCSYFAFFSTFADYEEIRISTPEVARSMIAYHYRYRYIRENMHEMSRIKIIPRICFIFIEQSCSPVRLNAKFAGNKYIR